MQMNELDMARLVELGEAEGFVDMIAAAPESAGIRHQRFGEALAVVCPAFEGTFLNQVWGLGLGGSVDRGVLREIASLYGEAGVNRYGVAISPQAQPAAEIPAMLAEHGIVPVNRAAKMYRLSPEPAEVSTDLRVELLGRDHAEAFALVIDEVFENPDFLHPMFESLVGRPGWRCYGAFDGEKLVATGFVYLRDGIAWLGAGATLPDYRRRGGQGAIMARRINDALAAGHDRIIVETTEDTPEAPNPSYHNMLRTGFQLAYLRQDYICRLK
jgi:hypothetical protein